MSSYIDFLEAANDWDLDRIFQDIEQANLTPLTPRDRKLLQGLLCDYSPEEIAKQGWGRETSASIRPAISKLYEYVELLVDTERAQGKSATLQRVNSSHLLRRALRDLGYRKTSS
jgi:hypothetical protein